MTVTQKQARQAMLKVVDPAFGEYSAGSGTVATVVLGAIQNGATGVSNRLYDGRWLYFSAGAGAGQVRKVPGGGYTPASGTLDFQPPGTAPSGGTTVEISSLFPAILALSPEETDSRTIINRALETVLLPRRLTLTITTSDVYTALPAWADRPERFVMDDDGRIMAWEPALIAGRQPFPASWRGIRFVRTGATRMLTLDAPFATASGSLLVDVLAPGHTFVNSAESTTGFVGETDSIDCDIADILPAIKREAYAVLMARSRSRSTGEYDSLYADARDEARTAKYHDWTREAPKDQPDVDRRQGAAA